MGKKYGIYFTTIVFTAVTSTDFSSVKNCNVLSTVTKQNGD